MYFNGVLFTENFWKIPEILRIRIYRENFVGGRSDGLWNDFGLGGESFHSWGVCGSVVSTVWSDEIVLSDNLDGWCLSANILKSSYFFVMGSIGGLETVWKIIALDCSSDVEESFNLLESISTIVLSVIDESDGLSGFLGSGSHKDNAQSNEYNLRNNYTLLLETVVLNYLQILITNFRSLREHKT